MGEQNYILLIRKILEFGELKENRTGIKSLSLFGEKMEFDLTEGFPLLTTKKVFFDKILSELLFFISGKTDTKILQNLNNNIWSGNTSKEFLEKKGLKWKEGDMGPGYSFQWRHTGAEYKGCEENYQDKGIDQLKTLIEGIKNDPYSRRHIINSWCVKDLDSMALPPCHCLAQFSVSNENELSCILYQRSADLFLGVPFNIASYALLTFIIASICDLKPKKFIHMLGDVHIYENHIDQCKLQISRNIYPFCNLEMDEIKNIDELYINENEDCVEKIKENMKKFRIINYKCHPYIKADMAI